MVKLMAEYRTIGLVFPVEEAKEVKPVKKAVEEPKKTEEEPKKTTKKTR
jgi:hypothetical protein